MKIWAHTLVKNEERYLWFAVMSVIEYVDKILIWDTGSTDRTLQIIKEIKKIYPDKVEVKEWGDVNSNQITVLRQKMLTTTKADWFIVVDGDEVWWEDKIKTYRKIIEEKNETLKFIVSGYYNLVGDIFHYQDENAGKYKIGKLKGHLNIRATSLSIPGLKFKNSYPLEGLYDHKSNLIQTDLTNKSLFVKKSYLHFTHLPRSLKTDEDALGRKNKRKYELGREFPYNFYYPEVLFKKRPSYVPCPWTVRDIKYSINAAFQTPFKYLKRKYS